MPIFRGGGGGGGGQSLLLKFLEGCSPPVPLAPMPVHITLVKKVTVATQGTSDVLAYAESSRAK